MGDSIPPTLPPARTPDAERMLNVFRARFEARLDKIRKIPLDILIWGPGIGSTSPVRQKRIQIRDELLKLGHNAMFSEELEDIGGNTPTKLQELAQAQLAHIIIDLLEDAPGALAEAHDFANRPDTSWKFFVLIPKQYEDGYSAKGAIQILGQLFTCVHWYAEGDIERCNVLTQVLKRVELVQQFIACATDQTV